MFTGLIEEVGRVRRILSTNDGGTQLQLAAPAIAGATATGDSIGVNGCCLSVTAGSSEDLTFDLLRETLARTNLGGLHADHPAYPLVFTKTQVEFVWFLSDEDYDPVMNSAKKIARRVGTRRATRATGFEPVTFSSGG